MGKPKASELTDESVFERVPVNVTCFRRLTDGNLYFVDDFGVVLDRYIRVVDQAGIAVVTRKPSFGSSIGGKLLALGVAVLAEKNGVPAYVARELLALSDTGLSRARAVAKALELVKAGDRRGAVLVLADAFGTGKLHEVLTGFSEDPRSFAVDLLLDEVRKRLQ
jgi:hypothetical protein